MKRLVFLLAASALTTSPAVAQHAGHNMPGMTMPIPEKKPAPKKKPAAKKPAAKKPAVKKAAPQKAPAKKAPAKEEAPTGHEGHDMSQMPGMETPAEGEHAGHDMGQMPAPEPQPTPPPPEALSGPEFAADAYWPGQPQSRELLRGEHGTARVGRFLIDRAETRFRDGRDGYLVDIQAWYGGDLNKLWLKSEIEGSWGKKLEHAEVQALWSHAVGPWFDLQAGARFDPQPGPNRSHLVLGVQGLAPYWFDVEGAIFLSNKGDVTARAEGEYDLLITQKLVLQPRAEVNFSLRDIPELGIGSGISDAELGLRFRYRFSPLFAPYVGVEYERAFGGTRDFRRAEGDDPNSLNFVAGLRAWF